ncbi:YbfB/YjiJ family MFS transporter [Helicobacter suis]|uniref:YbfB/YjiJ family MFS transporter n=1 Tax=Helicobacter suis TaxID=104628 RepID=UPI0018F83A61|nr:YbfB/YjiJ family MFS transporter [Helicobacter suis]
MRVFVCFLATFVSNGLARFGYTALIPFLILSGKLTQNQSLQLGIAVIVGYIFGSVVLSLLQKRFSLENIGKMSFLIIALSFFACYLDNFPFAWAWIWRFLAGVASSCLMILSAPLCLGFIKEQYRPYVSALVFSGIGVGVVFSGFALPHFAHIISWSWIFLGGLSFLAFLCSLSLKTLHPPKPATIQTEKFKFSYFFILLLISVALNAIGYLPHTLFWVDYLVRFLHFNKAIAGASWAFFGFGAVLGTFLSAGMSHKIGLKNASSVVSLLKTLSCILAAYCTNIYWLNLSIFLMGFTTTGNVVLTSTMIIYIVGKENKEHFVLASSAVFLTFGIFQALFSFFFTWCLGVISFYWMFMICTAVCFLSFAVLLPIPQKTFKSA